MDVNTGFTMDPTNMYRYISGFFMNSSVFIIIFAILIISIFIFVGLGKSSLSNGEIGNNSGVSGVFIGFVFLVFFILFILWIIPNHIWKALYAINLLNMTTTADVHNTFSGNPIIDIGVQQHIPKLSSPHITAPILSIPQVFNIPGNYYDYDDAKTLCRAYGSRLAKYDEVEKAYNSGAEWCNYGWSDGQMALFPTQAETYKNLQKIPGHEHDCGRQGINGGYIANPRVRFGVNCYGTKPKITTEEEELMASTTPYPLTEKDIMMDKQVDYWKQKLDNILVSPFNYNNWSRV